MIGSRLIATLHEWKNPIVIFCFGVLVGITLYFQDVNKLILFSICIALLLIYTATKNKKIILLVIGIIFSFSYNIVYLNIFTASLDQYIGKESIFIGEVASSPENNRFSKKYELNLKSIIEANRNLLSRVKNIKILISGSKYEEYEVGDLVQVTGKLRHPKTAILPGLFDEKKYLFSKGINYIANTKNGTLVFLDTPKSTIFSKAIYKLRKKLLSINKRFLHGDKLAIVNGIVFGSKASLLKGALKEKIQSVGLSHITSASGFNVSILAAGIFALFRIFSYRKKTIPTIICLITVLIYAAIADLSPSIIRATIFIIFLLIGNLFDKKIKVLSGISLILIGFFIANPSNLLDIGLQLSILGFLGLDLFASEASKDSKNWFLNTFYQSLFAQIMVIPLIVFYFHNIQLLGLISNLAAIPLASLILITGLINLIVSPIPLLGFVPGYALFYLSDLFIQWVNFLNKFEYKQIYLPDLNFYLLIIVYTIILIVLCRLFINFSSKLLTTSLMLLISLLTFIYIYTDTSKYLKIYFIPTYNQDSILIVPPKEKAVYLSTNTKTFNTYHIKEYLKLNNASQRTISYSLNSNLPAVFPSKYIKNDKCKIQINYRGLSIDVIKSLNRPIVSNSEYIKLPLLKREDPKLSNILNVKPKVVIINDYKRLSKKSINDIEWLKSQPFESLFLSKTGTISLISNGEKTFLIKQED